jgi:hypothetical protein
VISPTFPSSSKRTLSLGMDAGGAQRISAATRASSSASAGCGLTGS